VLDALDERDAIDATYYLNSLVFRADLRPLAGGATQFAATHAKASCYVELAPGFGRNNEKNENDGNVRRDLADVLQPPPPVMGPCERIDRAIEYHPGLHTPGDSVEAKVETTGDKIAWNRSSSIERADEVNALVATRLSRLASEKPRTIILAAPVLKYAADIHLLVALGGKTKSNDFAIVDEKPKFGKLGPGGVHQVAVRTRSVTQRDFRSFFELPSCVDAVFMITRESARLVNTESVPRRSRSTQVGPGLCPYLYLQAPHVPEK